MEDQVVQTPESGPRKWKWLLITAAVLALAAGGVWLLFGANQFYLDVVIAGQPSVDVEYGAQYADAGAEVTLRGTMFFKDGIDVEGIALSTVDPVDTGVLGEYTVVYTAVLREITAEAQRTVRVVDTTPPVIKLKDYGVPTPPPTVCPH